MVFDTLFKCDVCDDTVFRLRIQCDDSIRRYSLPLSINCPVCGTDINLTYSGSKGILPKEYNVEGFNIEHHEKKYDVPYSPQLPILSSESVVPYFASQLSPYLSLFAAYRPEIISKHAIQAKTFLDKIYPYRHAIKGLLPIYKKGNINAFSKKLAMEEKSKHIITFTSISSCRDALFDLIKTSYNAIAPTEYIRQIRQPYIDTIKRDLFFQNATMILSKLKEVIDLHEWQSKTLNWIGEMVNKFEKYLPSLFYLSVGDFTGHHTPNAIINSISFDESHNDYDDSFYYMKEILPLLVGLSNWGLTGDFNEFPNKNGGMKGIKNVKGYSEIPEGLMLDKISDYPEVLSFLCEGINTDIRNGIAHGRFNIDPKTQKIIFYPKANNKVYHYDIQLIDMCYLTVINFLHIIEFNLFLEELKKHK